MKTKYEPISALMQADAYKLSHRESYMASGNVTKIYSNFTNRKSRLEDVDGVVNFGLQAFLQNYCIDAFEPFFAADEDEVCKLYAERVSQVIGVPVEEVDTSHIRELHQVGYLPLEFKSFPEGTVVPFKVPSFTVENTNPRFFWLPNYIETIVSASVWYPSTSATLAHRLRKMLNGWAEKTGSPVDGVAFQGHDFSYRGQSSNESAMSSGAGHLLSFTGSDSLGTMEWIDYFYPGDNGMLLGSVPATEHSVMSLGIALHGEKETYKTLMEKTYPKGILSIVSDTMNLWDVLNKFLPEMHDVVMSRDGKIVIRPDTGDPADIVCGTKTNSNIVHTREVKNSDDNPDYFGVLELLWREFGGTVNDKGYKVLDSHVGILYGDSISYDKANEILTRMEKMGFASENIIFGVGSYFYVGSVTRDTFNSAMKATWAETDEKTVNLFKNPITGDGMKKSATGRLSVVKDENGSLTLIEKATSDDELRSELKTVWKDGKFTHKQSFADVRKTLAEQVL